MKMNPKIISKLIVIIPIVGIFFSIALITFVSYITIENIYQKQKEAITQNFFKELKEKTKKKVEVAYKLIDMLYKQNLNKPNPREATLKALPKLLDNFSFEKGDYIFVIDFKGVTYYHINHKLIGKNRWNLERNGVKIVQLLAKNAKKHPEGVYVEYLAYNPFGKEPIKKVSYVKVYKPLNVFIGNGVYLNKLDKKLLEIQKQNKEFFTILFKHILITSFIVLIIIGLFMFVISMIVRRIFLDYELALQREKEKLFQQANFDPLTTLLSRKYFLYFLKNFINEAKRDKKGALLFIDLDNFKEINDTYGHQIGDEVLKEVANRIKNSVREYDLVSRFGGDEFFVLLKDVNKTDIIEIVERILNNLSKPILINDMKHFVSASIGIAIIPEDSLDADELVKFADIAMYKAKNEGKNRFVFYKDELSKNVEKRLKLRNALIKAIENSELVPFFQPQIDKNSKLYGFEVLVRWIKNSKIIPPIDFIPIAIELKIIDKIDLFTLENAIKQYNKWLEKGYNPGVMSCNITMSQLEEVDFASKLNSLLKKYNFNPKYLNIEVTEESIMKNPKISINTLSKIKELGIGINIDDFGTGYSSLAYLKKLPVDKLKIDREFVKDIPEDKDDVILTKTIINLAKNLGLESVAEGVENEIQKEFLIENGCDYLQGYLISPPLNSDEFEKKFLRRNNDS